MLGLLFCGWSLWATLRDAGDFWPVLILFSPLLLVYWLAFTPLPLAAMAGWALAWGLFALWEGRRRELPR